MTQTADEVLVTVIVVPRDRHTVSVASLESIYQKTEIPFDLVYVDCLLRGRDLTKVKEMVNRRGDRYVRSKQFLYPNQARNFGIRDARGKYLVFVDNDVIVEQGWLKALVECAKETGAGVVGPLYLEGDQYNQMVHCAVGTIDYEERGDGSKQIIVCQQDVGAPGDKVQHLKRERTDLIEFHAVLVTKECLEAIGGTLDENLLTTRDHVDLCLSAERAGFDVYFEPKSRVLFANKVPLGIRDLRYYLFRWSDKATQKTISHFENKWDLKLDPERARIIWNRRRIAVTDVLRRYRFIKPLVPTSVRHWTIKRLVP